MLVIAAAGVVALTHDDGDRAVTRDGDDRPSSAGTAGADTSVYPSCTHEDGHRRFATDRCG